MNNKQTVLHGMTRKQIEDLAPIIESHNRKPVQPVPGGELDWIIPPEISEWIELMRDTCKR